MKNAMRWYRLMQTAVILQWIVSLLVFTGYMGGTVWYSALMLFITNCAYFCTHYQKWEYECLYSPSP